MTTSTPTTKRIAPIRQPSISPARSHVSEPQALDISARVEAPLRGSEVAILGGSLRYQRDTLGRKCSGLTQDQLARTLRPANMTLGVLMKHLAM